MTRLLTFILSVILVLMVLVGGTGWAQDDDDCVIVGSVPAAVTGDTFCTGLTLCQNFEGTGYDNSETWTPDSSTVDPDDTTATILRGSQQLELSDSGTNEPTLTSSAINLSEVYIHFLYRLNEDVGEQTGFFRLVGTGGNCNVYLYSSPTNGLSINCGGTTRISTTGLTAGTAYRIWIHWKVGSGSNGQCSVEYTAVSTKSPTFTDYGTGASGNTYAATSNGTHTNNRSSIIFLAYTTMTAYMDQVYVSSSPITGVPD